MKVLKDPASLFRAMNRKEREYQRAIDDASDVAKAAKAAGQGIAVRHISILVGSITLDRDFTECDMKRIRDYTNHTGKRLKLHEDSTYYEAWLARGRAEGAAWALKEIEKRMEDQA